MLMTLLVELGENKICIHNYIPLIKVLLIHNVSDKTNKKFLATINYVYVR